MDLLKVRVELYYSAVGLDVVCGDIVTRPVTDRAPDQFAAYLVEPGDIVRQSLDHPHNRVVNMHDEGDTISFVVVNDFDEEVTLDPVPAEDIVDLYMAVDEDVMI